MKTFKVGVLLLSLSVISSQLYAQSSNSKSTPLERAANDEIKIELTDSTLSATFQDKTLPVSNIVQIDNYLKSNPSLAIHKALILPKGKIDPERSRSLVVVLANNKIKIVRSVLNRE
jgi:hypothetical protein